MVERKCFFFSYMYLSEVNQILGILDIICCWSIEKENGYYSF